MPVYIGNLYKKNLVISTRSLLKIIFLGKNILCFSDRMPAIGISNNPLTIFLGEKSRRPLSLWLHSHHTTTLPTFPTFFILSHIFSDTHLEYAISDNPHCVACRSVSQSPSRSCSACRTSGTHIWSVHP